MAGTIVVDRIESDASYASTINVAGQITFSNTVNFGAYSGTAPVAGFYLPTTNNLAFTTASTERMRIDNQGNVGIGTTNPSRSKLVIGATTPQISFTDTDGTSNIVDITRVSGPSLSFSSNGTEVGRFDNAGLFKFNSGYGSVATAYGCRAWVNFNGTGTVAIRASGNVTSITDNGVGDYTVNFTTAMPDANYAPTMSCSIADGAAGVVDTTASFKRNNTSFGTGSFRLQTAYNNSGTPTALDSAIVTVSVFR